MANSDEGGGEWGGGEGVVRRLVAPYWQCVSGALLPGWVEGKAG